MFAEGAVMAWICQFCTGTHYLSDNEALGPCVCVTPATIRDLRQALDAERARTFKLDGNEPAPATTFKAKLLDQVFDIWDDYCVMQGAGTNRVGPGPYIRTHKPLFSKLYDAIEEVRRKVE
jgi:hypothetical protein